MADETTGHDAPARSSYAPLAHSSSTLFEDRAIAKRWTDAETRSRVSHGPKFRFDRPSAALLDQLVQRYQSITGDQIRRHKKRNLLAACYRVHGADVIPYIADVFTVQGTAQNLLGIIRCASPRGTGALQPLAANDAGGRCDTNTVPRVLDGASERSPDHDGPPCPIEVCLPDLIFCQDHFPAFDPTSHRRCDRRPSNPDAACYFGDQANKSADSKSATSGARAR